MSEKDLIKNPMGVPDSAFKKKATPPPPAEKKKKFFDFEDEDTKVEEPAKAEEE